ncbi:MAG: DNA-formamidopyrimidine glycosylase, partial [Ilumatobacter sp.]|nr:DNA-formamidopyrimidine glycosylase [Ilumatobacter sp.]
MPELPEVETVRRGLERFAVGRHVRNVEVGRERTVRRTSRQALIDGLTDTTIVAAHRRGKYLLLPLDSGDEVMIHLRMSGQVLIAPAGSERPPHTHVVLHLDDGNELWFVDPRTFGEVVVFDPQHVSVELPDLAALGPDPISEGLALPQLREILRARRRRLKPLLLDQHVIAGIGNIYADEILHAAKLRPDRLSNELSL